MHPVEPATHWLGLVDDGIEVGGELVVDLISHRLDELASCHGLIELGLKVGQHACLDLCQVNTFFRGNCGNTLAALQLGAQLRFGHIERFGERCEIEPASFIHESFAEAFRPKSHRSRSWAVLKTKGEYGNPGKLP